MRSPSTIVFVLTVWLFFCLSSPAQSTNLRFSYGSPIASTPIKIADNLIIVEVAVNGRTGNFIFDTGAESTVVNTSFATQAGLKSEGTTVGTGSAGSATAGIIRNTSLRVAGIEAADLTVYSLAIDPFTAALGIKIDGVLGNDIIGQLVVEIDYAAAVLTLYDPPSYRPSKDADLVPVTIEDNQPFIATAVSISGRRSLPVKLEIDTGSTGSLLLNSHFVRRHRLLTALTKSIGTRAGGVGGTGTSTVGRIAGVRFGRTKVAEPIVQLYTGTKGDNASAEYDGIVGGAIFRRFKMTVDMPGRRLFLESNAHLTDPFETDMSGIDLVADGDSLNIITADEVKPSSAAGKAGIRGGDVIRSINGRPASVLGMQEVRRLFRTAGSYKVEIARGRRVFPVRLVLKRIL